MFINVLWDQYFVIQLFKKISGVTARSVVGGWGKAQNFHLSI